MAELTHVLILHLETFYCYSPLPCHKADTWYQGLSILLASRGTGRNHWS